MKEVKISVAICICTRKRKEGLKRLLESIEKLKIPSGITVKVIIVENDSVNYSEPLVKEFSSHCKFKLTYCLEPRQGIVYARNRSVREAYGTDFICFTDDDQVVTSDWLKELMRCQSEFNADGVAGPTKPFFTKQVPSYIEKFHQPDSYKYGTKVESAFTGNLLLKKEFLDPLNGPFDLRLNFSGGEDSYLTREITDMGGVIRFNPDAIAFEFIPEDRTTIKFVIKRTFRTANTRLFITFLKDKQSRVIKVLPRLVMRFTNGLLIFLPFLVFGGPDRLKGLIKIVNSAGGFAFIFGRRSHFYRQAD
jgi:succinoglycan biosynthesis protein ExoM